MIASFKENFQTDSSASNIYSSFFFLYYHQIYLHYVTFYLKAFLIANLSPSNTVWHLLPSTMHPHSASITLLFCLPVVLHPICPSIKPVPHYSSSSLRISPSLNFYKACLFWNLIRYCLMTSHLI